MEGQILNRLNHRKIHQVAMDKAQKTLWIIFGAFAITFLFGLVPRSDNEFQFIPFSTIEMTLRSYIYYACEHIRWLILIYAINELSEVVFPEYKLYFNLVFFGFICFFVDFILTYHGTLFYIFGFGVSFPYIIATGLFLLPLVARFKNRQL